MKNIFKKNRPYLKDIINNLKKYQTWNFQLTITNNFISSIACKGFKNDSIETMINDEGVEIIEELFKSLKYGYQNNLQLMRGNEFVFDSVHLLDYKCHKINPNRGKSYIDSPDTNKKDECF